jgi:hypothetical protein
VKYYATKKSNFRIHNRKDMETEIAALPDGRYTIEIKKYRKNKSQEQLGYYFSCVLPMFLSAAVEQGWELTTVEECDAWLKSMFAERDLINRNTAEIVKIPALKRNMSTVEFMTYVDQVRNYCSEYFGVFIPDPLKQTEIDFKDGDTI